MAAADADVRAFWMEEVGAADKASSKAVTAALERFCEKNGQTAPRCLRLMVKHCIGSSVDEVSLKEFVTFVAVFAPFRNFVARAAGSLFDDVKLHDWYHGELDRGPAVAMLKGGQHGKFLVRGSSKRGKLAVMFVSGGSIKNCLLHNLGELGYCLHLNPSGAERTFPTVAEFIAFGKTDGKFTESAPSALAAVLNAEAALEPAAPESKSSYEAFTLDDGGYDPLPETSAAPSNYAAFDPTGGYSDLPSATAAAAPSNYAAFTDDMAGGADIFDPLAGAETGGNYGMFDPTAMGGASDMPPGPPAADGGGSYAVFMPGDDVPPAPGAPGAAAPSSYGLFDPTA